jgi:Fe-S cluster assembly iron-binding protein IscA
MFEVTEKAGSKIKDFLQQHKKPMAVRIIFQAC